MSIHIHLRYGFFSHVWFFATLWTAACQASLSFTISHSLLKLMSIESVMPSNLLLPSIFPSIRVFSNESALHIRWPKHWSFSFNISFSDEYSALISFRIDWFDLFAVQGTLKNLLQHHSSKVSILRHSAFFMVQLSHLYMTTGKTIALTRRTFVCQVISLLFNTVFSFVTAFFFYSMKRQSPAKCALSHRILSPSLRWVSWLDPPSPSFIFNILIIFSVHSKVNT